MVNTASPSLSSNTAYFPTDIERLLAARRELDATAFRTLGLPTLMQVGLCLSIDTDGGVDASRFQDMYTMWSSVIYGEICTQFLESWRRELFAEGADDFGSTDDATVLRAISAAAELRFLSSWKDRLAELRSVFSDPSRGYPAQGADFYAFCVLMAIYGTLFDLGPYILFTFTREISDIHIDGITMTLVAAKGQTYRATLPSFPSVTEQLNHAHEYARLYGKRFDAGVAHENLNSSHFHRLALRRDTTIFSGFTGAYRIQLLDNPTAQSMVDSGYITPEAMNFLQRCVEAEVPILVAGEAGSAKTTLLRALARSIARNEPILTVEESPELFLRMALDEDGRKYFSNVHDHIIQTSANGDSIGFADILKWALQESCRRMIVGEIPSGEIMSQFLTALSGHGSGMATLHASDIDNVIPRVTTLLSAYGVPQATAWSQIQDNLAVVVHAQLQRTNAGIQRFVTAIGWVVPNPASADAPPKILHAFTRNPAGQLTQSAESVRVIRNLREAEQRTKGVAGPQELNPQILVTA